MVAMSVVVMVVFMNVMHRALMVMVWTVTVASGAFAVPSVVVFLPTRFLLLHKQRWLHLFPRDFHSGLFLVVLHELLFAHLVWVRIVRLGLMQESWTEIWQVWHLLAWLCSHGIKVLLVHDGTIVRPPVHLGLLLPGMGKLTPGKVALGTISTRLHLL